MKCTLMNKNVPVVDLELDEFDSGTSLWHDKLTKNINGYDPVETKPFYADAGRQMELVSDYSWIPFEQLKMLEDDIHDVFASSEYMDEERIEAIVNAVNIRIEELQDMAVERRKHFPAR